MSQRDELTVAGPLPAGYRMAELDPADRTLIESLDAWAFAVPALPEEDALRPFYMEPGRIVGVWAEEDPAAHGPALAAVHASFAFTSFGVPGGTLPTAGLTSVGVHPQHRRRGLARAMVRTHLERTARRGEPLSALFASEPAIYGRFGYGRAAHHVRCTLPRNPRLRMVPGSDVLTVRVEHADRDQHGPMVDQLHRSVTRPGWAPRTTPVLASGVFTDLPSDREGGETLRMASVWDEAGEPHAYALFSRKMHWADDGAAEGTVRIREAVAVDGAASRALWAFLCDLDLMVKVESPMLALDDPLLTLLVDTRPVSLRTVDNVWVRLVDVPAALAGRAYSTEVEVVVDVADDLLTHNAGRWSLRGRTQAGASEVERTDRPADLSLDVRELATAYLGGVSLGSLAAAGLVEEHTPGALLAASAAFSWPDAPFCSWIF